MQTHLTHVVFGVRSENMAFYKELLTYMGWQALYDSPEMLGIADKNGASFWFGVEVKDTSNDYDAPGVNHLAIGTETQADVDTVAAYLQERGVQMLFETPRHRAEFSESDEHTYYQIMFESPDRILFEFVYTGPKGA